MPSSSIAPRAGRRSLLWSLLLLAIPAALLAHARLRRSAPASGERLGSSPAAITLWFSERPQLPFTRLRLIGPGGAEIGLGAPSAVSSLGVSAQVLRPLVAGAYVVVWQTGAADGHVTSGRFGFTVNTVPTTAAPVAPVPPRTGESRRDRAAGDRGNEFLRLDSAEAARPTAAQEAVTAWVAYIALLTIVGAVVFVLVVLRVLRRAGQPLPNAADAARRLAQASLVLVFIAMLSRLYMESALVNGTRAATNTDAVRTLVLSTTWGNGWLVGAAGALILLVALVLAGRRTSGWTLAAAGCAALALSPALTGHAVADVEHPLLAIAADALHVLGASIWLGTLLLIVLVGIPVVRRREAGERGPAVVALLRAFNPLALTGAALVGATGVLSAVLHLTTLADLWTTPYGRTLLLKLGTVGCVVLVGAYNWRRLTPTLGGPESPRHLRRSAALELLVAAAVLAVTAVLVGTATPDRVDHPPSVTAAP